MLEVLLFQVVLFFFSMFDYLHKYKGYLTHKLKEYFYLGSESDLEIKNIQPISKRSEDHAKRGNYDWTWSY